MNSRLVILVFLLACSFNCFAKTKKFCGIRNGTAGNALLMDTHNRKVIELSKQGSHSTLLDQADELVGKKSGVKGEEGTQNGKKYCVLAELDESGNPIKIIKAYLKK